MIEIIFLVIYNGSSYKVILPGADQGEAKSFSELSDNFTASKMYGILILYDKF